LLKIVEDLDIKLGVFTFQGAQDWDESRFKLSAKKLEKQLKMEEKH
jgi:hypothetical protein